MSKKDIYIHALEFGRNNLLKGITRNDLRKYLEDNGFSFDSKAKESNLNDMFNAIFGVSVKDGDGVDKNFMDMDAYFNYVEHQELIEARKSANTATVLAILAILISVGASYYSITQSTTINTAQFESLMTLKNDTTSLEGKVTNLLEKSTSNHSEQIKTLEGILKQLKSNKSLNQSGAKDAPPG